MNFNPKALQMEGFSISCDKNKINSKVVWEYLTRSYWFQGVKMDLIERIIENSLCFGVYYNDKQIGFARIITDYGTFAYLADVFVLEDFRGKGLSKWLMHEILHYPKLQGLRRIMLATKDAHGLYEQFGFKPIQFTDRYMEIYLPNAHLQ